MLALLLVVALAAPTSPTPSTSSTAHQFVVAYSSHTNPDHAARQLETLRKAGLKDLHTISSVLDRGRHIYRIVSRHFSTYAEARLALAEARRVLREAGLSFKAVLLDANIAGVPLIPVEHK